MRMQVIKGSGTNYVLYSKGITYYATARGKLKDNKVLVGDIVDVDECNAQHVIVNVHPRKNQLIRPVVSNIDQMCIVIAPSPKPDYTVIDKQLINCYNLNIKPIICINKIDIANEVFISEIKKIYSFLPTIEISTKTGEGIVALKDIFKNKLTALSGQSAVGKSSLVNVLDSNKNLKTDGLCAKIERGKHTTKHSEIHIIQDDILIIDTPGFSMLDIQNISQGEIAYLMPDFLKYSQNCKYQPCTHISENNMDCAIKQAVQNGELSQQRYQNYKEIFNNIKPEWERRKRDVKNSNFSFNTPRKKQHK